MPTPCGYINVCDFLKTLTVGILSSLQSPKHQRPNTAIKLNNIITPYDLDTPYRWQLPYCVLSISDAFGQFVRRLKIPYYPQVRLSSILSCTVEDGKGTTQATPDLVKASMAGEICFLWWMILRWSMLIVSHSTQDSGRES